MTKNREFKIYDSSKKKDKTYPKKPFITSTLQQSAQNELGFPVKMTMDLAQKLYENGHITYMRTDSTFISEEFQEKLISSLPANRIVYRLAGSTDPVIERSDLKFSYIDSGPSWDVDSATGMRPFLAAMLRHALSPPAATAASGGRLESRTPVMSCTTPPPRRL